jgi:transposase
MNSQTYNGPVEGHGNRLKTIKPQMYGRANFDLLKAWVLYGSEEKTDSDT